MSVWKSEYEFVDANRQDFEPQLDLWGHRESQAYRNAALQPNYREEHIDFAIGLLDSLRRVADALHQLLSAAHSTRFADGSIEFQPLKRGLEAPVWGGCTLWIERWNKAHEKQIPAKNEWWIL